MPPKPTNPNNRPRPGDRSRGPRVRNAGRLATDAEKNITPEERRAELKRSIGQAVMTQVMDRVKVNLNLPDNGANQTNTPDSIDKLTLQYESAGGDVNDLQATLRLLDLDDKGVDQITALLANANKGLSPENGRMFFTEAHASTQKIIDDIIRTGTARIVGPDGKLYDMQLIAVDAGENIESMPDCLSTDMTEKMIANEQFNLAGTYGIGTDNGLLPNMLHGEIVAESKIGAIQQALDNDSGREFVALDDQDNGNQVEYSFARLPADENTLAQIAQQSLVHAEYVSSLASAYLIDYPGRGQNLLPATAWYANHRTAQWEVKSNSSDQPTAETTTSEPASKHESQPAVVIRPVEPKPGHKETEKAREIYNSVVDYFATAIQKSAMNEDGTFDSAQLEQIEDLGSGEDSYGKIQGERSSLFVLSDGMGGQLDAADASRLTVEAFLNDIGITEISDEDQIEDVISVAVSMMQKRIEKARRKVYGFNAAKNSDSGATVVAAEVIGGKLVYGNVGDSSIFVVRDGHFILIAGDRGGHGSTLRNSIGAGLGFRPMPKHLMKEASIDQLSRQEREGNPTAHDKIKEVIKHDDIGVFTLEDGDRVVLCSDGIMGDWSKLDSLRHRVGYEVEQTLTDEEIVAAVGSGAATEATRRLIRAAKKPDDRSVQMFDIKLR